MLNNYPGWLANMIVDKKCGFAVPPEDALAFASALKQAADDRNALRDMGQRGQNLARSDFDRSSLSSKWVQWVTKGEGAP